MANLKFIVPREEMYGKLTFGGSEEEIKVGYGRNQRVTHRAYHLFSSARPGEDIRVFIPVSVGKKSFPFETEIEIVEMILIPKGLEEEGVSDDDNAFSQYTIYADDIVEKK